MKAMILAAGFGTRLFPLTIDRTKPAIPFLGKPLVGYVAEYVARFGFKDFIVNLHHQPESVRRIVELRFMGATFPEIAEQLNINERTARKAIEQLVGNEAEVEI